MYQKIGGGRGREGSEESNGSDQLERERAHCRSALSCTIKIKGASPNLSEEHGVGRSLVSTYD
jgi:hypothetical protein